MCHSFRQKVRKSGVFKRCYLFCKKTFDYSRIIIIKAIDSTTTFTLALFTSGSHSNKLSFEKAMNDYKYVCSRVLII